MQTNLFVKLLGCLTLLIAGVSCVSHYPTTSSMDVHYQHAEEWAKDQIALLDADLKAGKISKEYYDIQLKGIREYIPRKAGELAWAKYELGESKKRAAGIPTAELPLDNAVPSAAGGGSFYQRAGDYGMGNSAYGSPTVQYDRTPSEMREIRGY